jgi:aspartate-semialdehyde dehydrogenase
VRLLATVADQIGTVTDFAGDAALVQECAEETLAGVDFALLVGGNQEQVESLPGLPADATLVVIDPSGEWPEGTPVVAGISSESFEEQAPKVIISPSPTAILLAHLLAPLKELGPTRAVAQVLMPASSKEQAGLDELLDQTRSILAMQGDMPTTVFGKQIAFNLLPDSTGTSSALQQLEGLLGTVPAVALQVVQAGVFHSLSCSLFISFEEDPGIGQVRSCLAAHPWTQETGEEELPGPTDAAAREEVLVSDLRSSPACPGCYQLWAVMDNLTRGGALNVVEIIEGLTASTS